MFMSDNTLLLLLLLLLPWLWLPLLPLLMLVPQKVYDMTQAWDARSRRWYAERYDSRRNVVSTRIMAAAARQAMQGTFEMHPQPNRASL
jgi:hypothetical protein